MSGDKTPKIVFRHCGRVISGIIDKRQFKKYVQPGVMADPAGVDSTDVKTRAFVLNNLTDHHQLFFS